MASSREYLEFILGQLSGLEEITHRAMMGEYILYYRGKVIGGIYDDRLLVKPVPAAVSRMPEAPRELPYEGARPMLLVGNVDDREFLTELIGAMYEELPAPKPKKRRQALQERCNLRVAKNHRQHRCAVLPMSGSEYKKHEDIAYHTFTGRILHAGGVRAA